jgi:hypothetical protein
MKTKISAFVELRNKFFRKRQFRLNYFAWNITKAIFEGINNKINQLSRMAYSFKQPLLLAQNLSALRDAQPKEFNLNAKDGERSIWMHLYSRL